MSEPIGPPVGPDGIEPWKPGYRVWFDVPEGYGIEGWHVGTVVGPGESDAWLLGPNDITIRLDGNQEPIFRVNMEDPESLARVKPYRTPLPNPVHVQGAPRESEHRPGGMLNGARVKISYASPHRSCTVIGRVLEFVSVPCPHLVVEYIPSDTDTPSRKIVFCHAITEIELNE